MVKELTAQDKAWALEVSTIKEQMATAGGIFNTVKSERKDFKTENTFLKDRVRGLEIDKDTLVK